MERSHAPSLRDTYTDHHSLVEHAETRLRLLEEYRTLYTAALARLPREGGVVLGVTSPVAGEGKTTVATNVAGAMAADLEKRVLLTSCVFQEPDSHEREGEGVRPGLAEFVADADRQLSDLLVETPLPNLRVLFAGEAPDNPSRLVRCERMREVLAGFRQQWDITVVDLPPVLRASDTQILASQMDGVLLVVSLGESSMGAVERAVRALAGVNVVGLAANRAHNEMPRWLTRMLGGSEWVA